MVGKEAIILIVLIVALTALVHAFPTPQPYALEPKNLGKAKIETKDSFNVDLFTGSVAYSYDIDVPPGTNDLKPNLKLFYNSHNFGQRPGVVGSSRDITESYIQQDTNGSFLDVANDEFKFVLEGNSYDLAYVPTEERFHTAAESFLFVDNRINGNNDKGEYWLVKKPDGTKNIEYYYDGSRAHAPSKWAYY